jgi:dihydroorotase
MNVDALFDAAISTANRPETIVIRRPDDWHVHLRDGDMLRAVLPFTAAQFARGLIMPILVPPVTTVEAAVAYRSSILAAGPGDSDFQPLMSCYLTDLTSADEIERGGEHELQWSIVEVRP